MKNIESVVPIAPDAKPVGTWNFEKSRTDDLDDAIPELDETDELFMEDLPLEVMRLGSCIRAPRLPGPVRIGGVISIQDVVLKTPEDIWFHIKDTQLEWELDRLTQHLESYYSSHDDLNMRPFNAIPGQFCAVWSFDKWQRGEIVDRVNPNNVVKVHLIDVGRTANYELKNIRYLVKQFAGEHRYAFHGSLQPGRFKTIFETPQTISVFKKDTRNRFLVVGVKDINAETGALTLTLIAVTSKEDIIPAEVEESPEESMQKEYFRMYEKSAFRATAQHFGSLALAGSTIHNKPVLPAQVHDISISNHIPCKMIPSSNPFRPGFVCKTVSQRKEANPFRLLMAAHNSINNLNQQRSELVSRPSAPLNIPNMPKQPQTHPINKLVSVPGFGQYIQNVHFEENVKDVLTMKSALSLDHTIGVCSKNENSPEDISNMDRSAFSKDWNCVKFDLKS